MKSTTLTRVALQSILKNKMRTLLTMLGIVIGVGAVIVMVAIGQGAQAQIQAQIQNLGTNMLVVTPGAMQQGGASQGAGSFNRLTVEDAELLRRESMTLTAFQLLELAQRGCVMLSGELLLTEDADLLRTASLGVASPRQCLRYRGDDRYGFAHQLTPCDAHDAQTRRRELGIPPPIALEHSRRGVKCITVDFDEESFRTPEKVHLVCADGSVHRGHRQPRFADQGAKILFRSRLGQRRPGLVRQHRMQASRPRTPRAARQQ